MWVNCVGCPKFVAGAELYQLQFDYTERCLFGFELFVVLAERCGIGNVFNGNIKHMLAMALWSDFNKNDPLYSSTSSTHHAAGNPRHKYTKTSRRQLGTSSKK